MTSREELLTKALERSVIAIDDWLQTYAAELCDPARVEEASQRIGEYGTLSYIAHVQEQNRAALGSSCAQRVPDHPNTVVIARILHDHFRTGEPGEIEAIKSATAALLAALTSTPGQAIEKTGGGAS